MTHKIRLAELDKCLFPEFYPYYKQHFHEESSYLQQEYEFDKTAHSNINFKIKTVKFSQKAAREDVRKALYHLFNKHVEYFYDWHQSYDWYELKSILFFFLVFSETKTLGELEKLIKKPHTKHLLKKYLPKIK